MYGKVISASHLFPCSTQDDKSTKGMSGMPTSQVTLDNYLMCLQKSGLVEAARLGKILAEIEEDQPLESAHPACLAARLMQEGLLTPWQNENLMAGKFNGFVLGNYVLLSKLGQGGMGSVFAARHRLMNRMVAVKVLPKSRVDKHSYLERFLREAQVISQLNHPNIVRVYTVDNQGAVYYMVLELLEGSNLEQLVLQEGRPTFFKAADYIRQAADGLAHAHELNMVHRDIKPANLLVDLDGTLKILDMGLARLSVLGQPSLTVEQNEHVLGTADYMAPEQAVNSHAIDHRADIYSLGCTFYFLLSGRLPFPTGTLAQRLMAHQCEQPPCLSALRPDIPPALEQLCNRMMAKKPSQRIQTAAQVRDSLLEWLQRIKPVEEIDTLCFSRSDTQIGKAIEAQSSPVNTPAPIATPVPQSNADELVAIQIKTKTISNIHRAKLRSRPYEEWGVYILLGVIVLGMVVGLVFM